MSTIKKSKLLSVAMKDSGFEEKAQKDFADAYDKWADDIFRHCLYKVSDREKALDLMQETFMKTWKYVCDGNQIDNLRAFLYKTANNLVIDTYRKRDVRQTTSLDTLSEDGYEPSIDGKERICNIIESDYVKEAMRELSDTYRDVIIMRYVREMKVKEIARELQKSQSVISVRLYRGVRKLRKLLEGARQNEQQ